MEPELRLDKTDLFQALEGSLLQGDVTRDLAEDAFFTYLKGLDLRARLDVVAMYFDQNLTNAGISTLHVLGRSYGHPHKYFYRTYSSGTWSEWKPVDVDIEGNHIVLVIWKGNLNLFWVTFISQAPSTPQPSQSSDTTPVSNLSFSALAGNIFYAEAAPRIQVQLHWSEYSQGKWTKPIATDINHYPPITGLEDNFDVNRVVYIHVSIEVDANGNEGAAKIHLDLNGYDEFYAFRVTSKNCAPDFGLQYAEFAPGVFYTTTGIDATLHTGSNNLQANFESNIASDGTSSVFKNEPILQTVNNFALLTCANPVVPSPFLDKNEPLYQDAGSLASPFFFKDTNNPNAGSQSTFQDELTFFVQPTVNEDTVVEWKGWAVSPPIPPQDWADPNLFNQINVLAQVPAAGPVPVNPGDPVYSVYPMQTVTDWLTNPTTAVSYGDVWVGKSGRFDLRKISTSISTGAPVSVIPVITAHTAFGRSAHAGFTFVGKQGLNLSQAQATGMVQSASPVASSSALSNRRTS
jgi:hypothetical protein